METQEEIKEEQFIQYHIENEPEEEEQYAFQVSITLPKIFYELHVQPITWKEVGHDLTAYIGRTIVASVCGDKWLKTYGNTIRLRSFSGDKYISLNNRSTEDKTKTNGRFDKERRLKKFEHLIQKHLREEFAQFLQPEAVTRGEKSNNRFKKGLAACM